MSKKKPPTPSPYGSLVLWALAGIALVWAYTMLSGGSSSHQAPTQAAGAPTTEISYTQLLRDAEGGRVHEVFVRGSSILIKYKAGDVAYTDNPGDPYLVSDLKKAGVEVFSRPVTPDAPSGSSGGSTALQLLISFGPVLLIVAVMLFIFRQQSKMMSGKGGGFTHGKATVHKSGGDDASVTFKDVAGCDEAKEEVGELVDFLRDPQRFQKLGGRIPRGVLLSGPPGTGKTLLAKAIAGEAKVPFLSMSGSGFVEMFVGVGAARVRDLFAQAKAQAPCIVFIDEIDAVGRARGAGHGGGNDEREQTLNQMLVEMDGFEPSLGIIVIAATNRPDILDPALTRPGRFDRQVFVSLPDVRGREQILGVHMRKVPVAAAVDLLTLARGTPGFSGADLANLVNEAALFAARRRATHVEMCDFEAAKDKVVMGPERKSMVMPEEERRNTAYHEAGHAVIARLLPKTDPVHKVTIIPRGRALGVTMQLPEGDRYSTDKERLESTIAMLFGGRVAEELFMQQATTGASNDFERATAIARNMVTRWGYSEVLGPMVLANNETDPGAAQFLAPETLREVDKEIRDLLRAQYGRVQAMLKEHADKMHVMANALLEWETLDADQVNDIMDGRKPRPPKSGAKPQYEASPAAIGASNPAAA